MKTIITIAFSFIIATSGYAEVDISTSLLTMFPISIPDGSAIVLKRGDNIGIAVLKKQTTKPETFSYNWYYRTDGKFDFRTESKEVKRGTKENVTSLNFGSFEVEWSVNRTGKGFIYLNNSYYTGVVIEVDEEKLNWELLNLPMIKYTEAKSMIPDIDLKHLH